MASFIVMACGMAIMACFVSAMNSCYKLGFWSGAIRAAETADDDADDRPFLEKIGEPSLWREFSPQSSGAAPEGRDDGDEGW